MCKTYWNDMAGCEGIILDVDSKEVDRLNGEMGSETITWNKGAEDPYTYLIYVHDYSEQGFSESAGRISFYGETIVKMEVEDGNNEDRWISFQLGQCTQAKGITWHKVSEAKSFNST